MDLRETISLISIVIIFITFSFVDPDMTRPAHLENATHELSARKCDDHNRSADVSLRASSSSVLRKLAEYETLCGSSVVDELMMFTAMPHTMHEATDFAKATTATLKEFAHYNIPPLVVFEPGLRSRIDLADVKRGIYDQILLAYFENLKALGISDQEMGTWVLFPEPNTPAWLTTNADDFIANITKAGSIQKEIFPGSKISALLNSRTYPNNDTHWSHGVLKSLLPYVQHIPAGLVDRFGYQGFPSISAANAIHPYNQLDASDFLPAHLASEAAAALNIHDVWFNTGTFSRIHTGNTRTEVRVDSVQRHITLQSILRQANQLKSQQFNVSINLFSEDKSKVDEHVDWSYWQPGKSAVSPYTKNFLWFVQRVKADDMRFSLYDHG